jgi:hypothetical protein
MYQSLRFSDRNAILGSIDPVSQGAGTVLTAWVPVAKWNRIAAILQTGVLGAAATVDAKLRQSTDAAGTGAKDITGKAITQLVKATDDNKMAIIECTPEDLDTNNSFTHVALSVTVGAAASLISAVLLGVNARYQPASDNDDADVKQIVG